MNSSEVLAHLDQIAASPSKNDKQAMVTTGMQFPLFQRVCEYAYNPFKTYGVRKVVGKAHEGFRQFDAETWQLLDDLIARRLTGQNALEAIAGEIDQLDEGSADLLVRIIRKDLRAGFSESTINKACKGLIPDFPYMRCSLPKDTDLDAWPWAEGVPSQEKADGMFANVDHEESGLVAIRSRQGTEFPIEKFQNVVSGVREFLLPGHQQHGEFVVMRDGKVLDREIGNGIMNHVINGGDFGTNEKPVYLVWDQIPLTSVVTKGKFAKPYRKRLLDLILQLRASKESVRLIPTRLVHSKMEAYAHAGELMKLGKEGTVIKHPAAIWKDGTSKEQIKLKLEFDVDLEIEGIVPGRAGTKNEGRAGSFACRTSDGFLKVDVTVKNEALRDAVDANPDEFIGKVIEVVANDIMEPSESNRLHSLFLPRMKTASYRTDKTNADDLDRVFSAKECAILGQTLAKAA